MLSCPNKSSKEWREALIEANGIEEEALKIYNEKVGAPEVPITSDIEEDTDSEKPDTVGEEVNPDDTNTEYKNLISEIRIYLKKQLAILKRKVVVNQTNKEGRLKTILDKLEGLDEAEAIDTFITEAYNQSVKAKDKYKVFLEKKDSMSKKEAISRLLGFYEFANGYNILDEISKVNIDEFYKNDNEKIYDSEGKLTPQFKLSQAINIRENIKREFIKDGIPLMANFLWQYKSDYESKNLDSLKEFYQKRLVELTSSGEIDVKKAKQIETLKKDIAKLNGLVLDKESLESLLKTALEDEGALDFLVGPLISSPDAVLSLFAKSVKSQFAKARLESLKVRDEIMEKFDAYAQVSGKAKDNPKSFNEGIYELLDSKLTKEDGTEEIVKRPAFVQKYNINSYRKARKEFFDSLGPKPTIAKDKKEYYQKMDTWFRENSQPKSKEERDKIISEKKKLKDAGVITDGEYSIWYSSVYSSYKGKVTYKGELAEPSDKWINDNWKELYNLDGTPKNAKGELHKKLLDEYLDAQSLIPEKQRLGYFLPNVPKTSTERLIENGIGKTIKRGFQEKFKTQVYDVGYEQKGSDLEDVENEKGLNERTSLSTLGGVEVKFLPTYFTQKIDPSDISLDVTRSVLLFSQMAKNYQAMNEISGETTMLKAIVGKREVVSSTSKGELLIDAFAKKEGYLKFISKNGEAYSKKHLDAFIDMVVYGEMNKAEEFMGLDVAKITDTVISYSAITSLALDAMKGIANNLQGNIQLVIEAAAGDYFSSKNLFNAKKNYKLGAPFLQDFGKPIPKSLEGKLVEYYDAMQGEFKDQYGKKISNTAFLRLFNTNTLFFNMHAAEHEIQVTTMFALMDAEKVIDNETGKEITLFEAHKKYGRDGVHDNTNFSLKRKDDFENRLHAINKRLQGVYNDFDKGTAQRYALGRVLLMYRKHMVPAYMRRFKKVSYDYELDDITQGFYRTFWNTMVKDLFVYKKNILKEWSNYSPYQKAQINRTLRELAIVISAITLIFIMASAADDDEDLKKSTAFNHVYYQLIRMRSETMTYYPVIGLPDLWKVLKSPTAAMSSVNRTTKFINQFLLTWNEEDLVFQKDTGVFEKGDNKSWAYFLKMIGLTGNNLDPAEAVKGFEATFNR